MVTWRSYPGAVAVVLGNGITINNRTDVFINLDDCILQNKNSKIGLIPINYRESKLIRRPESKQVPGEPIEMREKKYARVISVQEEGCGQLIKPRAAIHDIPRESKLIRRPVSKLRLIRKPVSKQVPGEQIEIHEMINERVISVQEESSDKLIRGCTYIT